MTSFRKALCTAVVATGIGLAAPAPAQDADTAAIAAQQQAMKRLAWMDGQWRGTATTQTAQGEHRVTQTERIGNFLQGSIKVIEGRGFRTDGSMGFNAFGIVSYDAAADAFTMHSYAQGRVGDFALKPTADGYIWTIPAGPMTIRYTASVKDGVWTEIGEHLVEGKTAVKFFEMTLRRVGPSTWPESGAMKPR